MSEHDDLHARADEWVRRAHSGEAFVENLHELVAGLAAALRAVEAERDELRRRLNTVEDPFTWRGTWHVRHADGTDEDIVLEHGNLVEDNTGSCGQFLLDVPDADPADQETETDR